MNTRKSILLFATVLFAFVLNFGQVSAAPIVPPAGSNVYDPGVVDQTNLLHLKEVQRQAQETKHVDKEDIILDKEMYDEIEKLPNKEIRFILNSVEFKGNTIFSQEELLRIVCDSIETEVSIDDLIKFANLITEEYHKRGYISSLAYVPPQNIEGGNVEIVIIEGKYGNVTFEGNKWARDKYIRKQLIEDKNIEPQNILNIKDIQDSIGTMNSLDYIKGVVTLQDNEESAEYTDVIYDIKDRFPIDLDLRFDNQGRTSVGLNRFVIFAGMHNLTGFGDQLLSTTSIARRSVGQGVFYSVPFAKKETKLNLGYSFSGTDIGDMMGMDNIKGKSHNFFAGVSRRLVKTENYKMYGDVSLDIRNTKTTFDDPLTSNRYNLSEYNTRAIRVNLSNIKDDFYGKWYGNVGASFGVPWFDASDEWKDDKSAPSNNFVKFNGTLARIQTLPWRTLGIFQANGQWANRALWYSEQMQIGGISSVRGYEEAFALGDYGVTASAEFRTPIPFLGKILPEKLKFIDDSIQLAGFYDVGWFGHSHSDVDSTYLMSVGGGVILKLTKYLSGNVYIGVPIGKKYEEGSKCRVHFTVTSNIL